MNNEFKKQHFQKTSFSNFFYFHDNRRLLFNDLIENKILTKTENNIIYSLLSLIKNELELIFGFSEEECYDKILEYFNLDKDTIKRMCDVINLYDRLIIFKGC